MTRYVCSGLEMAEMDRQAIEDYGVPGRVLMELAGRGVADEVTQHAPPGSRVVVLCGPGANGGDGFVCARALAAAGYRTETAVFANRGRLQGDSRAAFQTLEREGTTEVTFIDDARELWDLSTRMTECRVVVDALLGTGLREDVRGLIGDVIDVVNEKDVPVVAVDLPSGVDSDTGRILGRALQADATVTFAFAKRGHYLAPGKDAAGSLRVVDIGIPVALADTMKVVGRAIGYDDGPALIPKRNGDTHKGTYGHVVVLGGSPSTPGAAILSALGALRAGAGLVSWATEAVACSRASGLLPEIMLRIHDGEEPARWAERICERAEALVVGPGLGTGDDQVELLRELFRRTSSPLCLDADALTLMGRAPELWDEIHSPVVVTPHPKEMARLVGGDVEAVQRDRFASALQLALGRGCVVVLKGAGTVVADPEGLVTVLDAGNPGMATGGTGDVLAGVVGGLLAQGIEPSQAGLGGALLHSCAGDLASAIHGQAGMSAGDVIDGIGDILADWDR
ncbi:MAG: NAD(P)H-hydrate dehydratase [Myxococcota bacterium]